MPTQIDHMVLWKLKELDKQNRPAPWSFGGKPNGRGKMTYNLYPHEEDLVITMRNHIGDLIKIIEEQEAELKRLREYESNH